MSASKHIGHLRAHLFDQLDMLCDLSKAADLDRARMVCETSKQIIDAAKVEIAFAEVLKGALTVPFIENQEDGKERPHAPPAARQPTDALPGKPPLTSEQRKQQLLNSGPPASHPWNGLGNRRVHHMGR